MATLAEQEARRDCLSGSSEGGAIEIDADYDTESDVTTIHYVSAGHADAVFVQVHNSHTSAVDLKLILNPDDDTMAADIDAVTVTVEIPAKDSLWVLQGDTFRTRGTGNTKSIAAYVGGSDTSHLRATGYVVRGKGASIY